MLQPEFLSHLSVCYAQVSSLKSAMLQYKICHAPHHASSLRFVKQPTVYHTLVLSLSCSSLMAWFEPKVCHNLAQSWSHSSTKSIMPSKVSHAPVKSLMLCFQTCHAPQLSCYVEIWKYILLLHKSCINACISLSLSLYTCMHNHVCVCDCTWCNSNTLLDSCSQS